MLRARLFQEVNGLQGSPDFTVMSQDARITRQFQTRPQKVSQIWGRTSAIPLQHHETAWFQTW